MTQDDLKEEFRCCECKEDLEHTQMICWTCFCRLKDKIRQEDVEEFKKKIDEKIKNYRTMWGVKHETVIQSAFIQELEELKSSLEKDEVKNEN